MNRETNSIEQGNRLIAEFMGMKKRSLIRSSPQRYETLYGFYKEDEMQYHSSWDWFMGAYAKFLGKVKTEEIELDHEGSALWDLVEHSLTLANINSAFEYFVQLIEWYNKEQIAQASVATGGEQGTKS